VTILEQPSEYGLASGTTQEPKEDKPASELDKLGVEIADLTPELAKQFGYKEGTQGVVITRVEPDSLAANAGLQRGLLLVKVDKKNVKDAAAVREAVSKATLNKGVLLQVRNAEGMTDFVLVKPEAVSSK
jgi:serine protease Do